MYRPVKIFNQCNHRRRLHDYVFLFLKGHNVRTLATSHNRKNQAPFDSSLRQNFILNYNYVEKYAWSVSPSYLCNFHTSSMREKKREKAKEIQFKPKSQKPICHLWKGITVREFAKQIERPIDSVFEAIDLLDDGHLFSRPNSEIHLTHVIVELAKILGCRPQFVGNPHIEAEKKVEANRDVTKRPPPCPSDLVKRPPVVTIMGHVDHGKTTLLDALRHTSVVKEEFGGITQHIGAFTVELPLGQITFLDTPGHAAFKAMRSRGANVTDLVVLVVAADDGVMEQTVESIRFANEAKVPMIVAINKIDKPNIDVNAVKNELLEYNIQLEDFGGDVQSVNISALKKMNLDQLIEAILVQAEVMNISGDPTGLAEGVILESNKDIERGRQSTSLIQRGTLRKGSFVVSGTSWAKVKGMLDEWGKPLTEVKPGFPARIYGWKNQPIPGDDILEVPSEKMARKVVECRNRKQAENKMLGEKHVIEQKAEEHHAKYSKERAERLMAGYFRRRKGVFIREKEIVDDPTPHLSIVLKGDVDGSIEAILDVMSTYQSHQNCRLDVLHSGVGDVTENDVEYAEIFNGIIYCFNVDMLPNIKNMISEKAVPVKNFNVIYHLIDDLKCEINKRLPLLDAEEVTGVATVIEQFIINQGKKKVPVAGCKCTNGVIKKGDLCKVVRSDKVIHTGSIQSLRNEKTDVNVIKKDSDCGLRLENAEVTFEHGDTVTCFHIKKVSQSTDWYPGF